MRMRVAVGSKLVGRGVRVAPNKGVGEGPPVASTIWVGRTVGLAFASGVWVGEGVNVGVILGNSVGMMGKDAPLHAVKITIRMKIRLIE